jgi:hypothetical protein
MEEMPGICDFLRITPDSIHGNNISKIKSKKYLTEVCTLTFNFMYEEY